jgi:hypothetical protein
MWVEAGIGKCAWTIQREFERKPVCLAARSWLAVIYLSPSLLRYMILAVRAYC